MSRCKLCEEFYLKYPLRDGKHILREEDGFSSAMDQVECAFESGVFSKENWNCRTMARLRDYAVGAPYFGWSIRDEGRAGSFGVVWISSDSPIGGGGFYVLMTWYKNRGRTEQAWVMSEEEPPSALTLVGAEAAIKILASLDPCGALR